jgi:hypothetical protein
VAGAQQHARRDVLVVLGVSGLWEAFWTQRYWDLSGLSWHFFADGSRLLIHGDGLDLYAHHPELQIGPLSLVVAAVLRPLGGSAARATALVLMAAVGPLLLALVTPRVAPARRLARMLLVAALLIPAWSVLAVRWGHLDDVLAMTGGILAIRAVLARRPVLAGLALAAAMASKPWAIGFVPVLLGLETGVLRAAVAAGAGTVAAWGPFLLANSRTTAALHPPVALSPSSGLHALGVRGNTIPAWGRAAQLLLAPAIALLAALTRRWAGVLLVAVAVRLALDPQDNAYYVGSAVIAAAVFDLLGTAWLVPWTTLATVVALWQPFVRDFPHRLQTTSGVTHWWFAHQGAVGVIHLAWSLLAVVLVFVVPAPAARAGRGWRRSRPRSIE